MYPGFNKVVQAVGRVIRSDTDRGIAILLDERFNFSNYKQIMPSHWSNKKIISSSYVLKKEIESFYKK
jgi:Rad3-related DNA helicase